ncbi:MAG: S9 family peptidase [Phycisphaerales bacterium]|nr:S9 family peptidase [Phycisphaerales bacterium]
MTRKAHDQMHVTKIGPIITAVLLGCLHGCNTTTPTPPDAPARPTATHIHDDVLVDEYAWIRERSNPEVIAYLEAENEHADAVMAHTRSLQERLYEEMLGRIKEDDVDVPYRKDDWLYYTRTEESRPYPIHCRRKGSMDAPEQVLLDVNVRADGKDYCGIEAMEVSPNGRLLAWLEDHSGYEKCRLYVKDLETGELIDDSLEELDPWSLAWANDNRTIFYARQDDANRADRIYRHRLGDDASLDQLVYEDPDGRFYVDIARSRSGRWLIAGSGGQITSEYHVLDADEPDGEFIPIAPRRRGVEYSVEHSGDRFYIRTNEEAPNFKIMSVSEDALRDGEWTTVVPHDASTYITGLDAFRNHLVLVQRQGGYQGLRVIDLRSDKDTVLEMPELVSTAGPDVNESFDTNRYRFEYESLVTPATIIEVDLDDGTRTVLKRREVLGGFDPEDYQTIRLEATGHDGTLIPISLVHRRDVRPDGSNPLYLTGYGAYGSPYDPYFSSNRVSLLDRGVVHAIAHVRGGGELGRAWYESGKFLEKKNTFLDFISCAEMLVSSGWASPDRIAIEGGSAGGLLIGAVINMRPDLFAAAIADVPFVDVMNTMLDPTIPLTIGEYEEWGNPEDPVYYEYMKSYSPYDNVFDAEYPDLLVLAGLNDPRVHYWEPAKWVARLRDHSTGNSFLIFRTNMGAGHGGASGRYDRLREIAFQNAFVLDRLDVE